MCDCDVKMHAFTIIIMIRSVMTEFANLLTVNRGGSEERATGGALSGEYFPVSSVIDQSRVLSMRKQSPDYHKKSSYAVIITSYINTIASRTSQYERPA